MGWGQELEEALGEALGSPVTRTQEVSGGCINDGRRVALADGRAVFVKTHPSPPPRFFETEAAALDWLAVAGAARVPQVLAVGDPDRHPAFLALEWIETGVRSERTDEVLGRDLASLHRAGTPAFGWDRDGYIGDLTQPNGPLPTWAEFYGERRIEPLARRAIDRGGLPREAGPAVDRLLGRLPELVGPEEAPARLHGDLWGGNHLVDTEGRPWLIDPAPYGGHREVDLAMMRLFGGFGSRCFSAYAEVHPLADGHENRVLLYQLYPLLVHVTLFGHAYTNQTLAALHHYA